MLKKILLAIAAVLIAFLAFIYFQPNDFEISREAMIYAPAQVVFDQVNDFHKWEAWSPWAKMDPNAKNTFEGPTSGAGAVFSWEGNDQVGSGKMTITESTPPTLIHIRLDFLKPFAATNQAEFTFAQQGDQTKVVWRMSGQKVFISKIFCFFMNMDKMVGGEFEKGLAQMKVIAEAAK